MISPAIAPETIIADRYIIKEFIGEGGMQLVYKALDTSMERVVALKVPKILQLQSDLSGVLSLVQESRILMLLKRLIILSMATHSF